MSTAEDHTSDASGMAEQRGQGRWLSGLREGYAEIGDVRLHYVEAGDGPLIVLLHGFPEFWYGWRHADRTTRGGGIPRRRTRHARLQPVIKAERRRGLQHRQAGRRHPRSHPANAVPSPRCWWVTTGAEPPPGPPR